MKLLNIALFVIILFSMLWLLIMVLFPPNNTLTQTSSFQRRLTSISIPNNIVFINDAKEDEMLSTNFEINNIGEDTLIISSVNPDCSCTQFFLDDSIVRPGCNTMLRVYVNTHNKFGNNSVNVVATVNTINKYCLFKIVYNVDNSIIEDSNVVKFVRDTIDIGMTKLNRKVKIKQFICNNSSESIFIKCSYTSCDCLKIVNCSRQLLAHSVNRIELEYESKSAIAFCDKVSFMFTSSNIKNGVASFYVQGDMDKEFQLKI